MQQKEYPIDCPSGLRSRVLLTLIAFFCGAATMIIELAGNKVLAPVFGNTLYTWTGLIGIILIAMSSGYYFGGWLADCKPSYTRLAHIISIAAILTFLTPLLQVTTALDAIKKNIIWGPVLASILLFSLPAFFLSSVTPFSMRLASLLSKDQHIGGSTGYIGMLSTLGSVIGTFCTGFILIPALGIRMIFTLTGILLAILAGITYLFFFAEKNHKIKYVAVTALVLILFPAAISAFSPKVPWNVVFEKNTFYHRIAVIEEPTPNGDIARILRLDTGIDGAQFEYSDEPVFPYQQYWRLIKAFCPRMEKALFLGGGAFYLPQAVSRAWPQAYVEVVEIDPEVVAVGEKFFRLNQYPQVYPRVGDGRRHLSSQQTHYDLIFGDAYNGIRNIPAHLITLEFFSLVKEHLNPDGVYIMNIISAPKGKKSQLFLSTIKTLKQVFDNVYCFPINLQVPEKVQNIIIVATTKDNPVSPATWSKIAQDPTTGYLLSTYLPESAYDATAATVFTDDYNPVEYIVAQSLIS
ncbi:MAG: fused MFS/spermidine synthase [Candidatus Omnitrophica bacterium]|nr:fused MFS/spermidine synthase [Candidatus Omnitrophota bacterium]